MAFMTHLLFDFAVANATHVLLDVNVFAFADHRKFAIFVLGCRNLPNDDLLFLEYKIF